MAVGTTITGSLADSLPTWLMSARQVREYEGVVPQLVERQTLGKGLGTSWREVSFAQLSAQAVTESTRLNNPQQLSDTIFTVEPSVIGIHTCITDRVANRIAKVAYAKIGGLAQNAIERKKDEDGITVFDGFSVSHGGAGVTMVSGYISAAVAEITGNSTEPGNPPFRCVLHPYQVKDLEDELIAGVGTYPVGEGLTARVFKERFSGMIAEAQVYKDGNITADSSDDAKGAVFAQEAIVLVQGTGPRAETKREPDLGGGATSVYHYDEYAYGERQDLWGVEIYTDVTTPTS